MSRARSPDEYHGDTSLVSCSCIDGTRPASHKAWSGNGGAGLAARVRCRYKAMEPNPRVIKDPVWSKNSCGFTLVVFEEAPEPFTTLKRSCTCGVLADRRKEQHVALALMIPLVMKMRHVLRQRMAE